MTRRSYGAVLAAVAVLALGFGSPVRGDDSMLPGSCKPHPNKVANPGCGPTLTGPITDPDWTLPNLVPDVRNVVITQLTVLDPETQTFVLGPPVFAFDTWAQNLGSVPIDLLIDQVPPEEVTPVAQCISWVESKACRERARVGGLVWHDPHTHYHFEEFASYELRRLGADGRPDYSAAGLVAASEKVSFCLVDSEKVRDDAFPLSVYGNCSTPTVMGVSSGWADIYDEAVPGQQFARDLLDDGRYALIVNMDYADHLFESNNSDNVVEVVVEFSNGVTEASIVDKQWPAP